MTTRRDALKQIGAGAAALALPKLPLLHRFAPLVVAGQPAELAVSSVSPITVRLMLRASRNAEQQAIPFTGALAKDSFTAVARGSDDSKFTKLKAGNVVVRVTASPPVIQVETTSGEVVQRLAFDAAAPGLTFALPKGPLLGLGEGGPQFDRKGSTDAIGPRSRIHSRLQARRRGKTLASARRSTAS